MPENSPCERPLLLTASPRAGGNCDLAAELFAQGFAQGGKTLALARLRDFHVLPCVACGACAKAAARSLPLEPEKPFRTGRAKFFGCPLSQKDGSGELLRALFRAEHLCFVSPIYFYHLPAAFKAVLDRLQPFWHLREAKDARLEALPPRSCRAILIAARHEGEKLFEGSLLTLKYALAGLNVSLAEPLLLRGLDGPRDLRGAPALMEEVRRYGREAAAY